MNIASFAGPGPAPPGLASYSVAKAGVVALSESLRARWPCIAPASAYRWCPAFFQTNLPELPGPGDRARHGGPSDATLRRLGRRRVARIYDAVAAGRFLVLPTAQEPLRWRLKRWLPEVYFRKLIATIAAQRPAA